MKHNVGARVSIKRIGGDVWVGYWSARRRGGGLSRACETSRHAHLTFSVNLKCAKSGHSG